MTNRVGWYTKPTKAEKALLPYRSHSAKEQPEDHDRRLINKNSNEKTKAKVMRSRAIEREQMRKNRKKVAKLWSEMAKRNAP